MAKGSPQLRTRLVSRAEAATALGVSRNTFWRHWAAVFTDPRDPADRRPRMARRVYEDELAVAVEAGGGTSRRAMDAVRTYRLANRRALG